MPRNASGTMSQSGDFALAGQIASSAYVNAKIEDILDEITDSLSRSGKGGMSAPLAMGNNKITGLANGTAATDAAAYGQLQTSVADQATTVTGSGDAIVASFTPAITTLTANLALRVTAPSANTIVAPQINIDGLGNKTIKKLNGLPLVAGDIAGAGHVLDLVYNGTDIMLLNPSPAYVAATITAATDTAAGIVELATAAEYRANTPSNRALTNSNVWTSAETVALTDAATVAVDMSTFINATLLTTSGVGATRALGQPSNTKVGQSGFIRITQDATGSRAMTFHADWKFTNGTDPTLSTAANAIDILFYEVIAANYIYASLSKAVA